MNDRFARFIHDDHETGEVCGVLCFRRNAGRGPFTESIELLLNAGAYLEGARG